MTELKDFFAASVGAAAALVGLLFVAITLAPDKIFGEAAEVALHSRAFFAFTALENVFFVSLAALVPRITGPAISVIAFVALVQTLREGAVMRSEFPAVRGWRRFGFISSGIYLLQCVLAVRFSFNAMHPEAFAYIVFGLYAYALGSSWSLVGGNRGRGT